MATLTGQTIADTYLTLLRLSSATIGADSSAKYIHDAADTASALSISTTKVGIGTAAPNADTLLHTKTSSTTTNRLAIESNAEFLVAFVEDADLCGLYWKDGAAFQIGQSSVIGGSGYDARVTILDGGNVGIGTATPAALMHVNVADLSGFTPEGYTGLVLEANDHVRLEIASPNDKYGTIYFSDQDGRGGQIDYDHANNKMFLGTTASVDMTIDTDGNVGIGTSAPAGLLDISSDGTTADYTALAFASGQLRLTNSTDPADDTKRYAAITFAQRDDEVARIVSKMNKNSSSADTYGDLRFLTKGDGDAALTERMTILEDGNVGIGAAAPTKPLCFGSSAVGHGMIDDFATTIYGALGLAHATAGGLKIEGYRDADGDGEGAVLIKGALGEAAVDTKTTGAGAIIFLQADIKSSNTTTTAGTDQNLMALRTGSTTRYIWDAEGSGHADVEWVAFSDSRLKTSIEDVPYGLAEVLQLQPKRYDKESGSFDDSGNVVLEGNKRKMIGFMAQDIKTIIPELVKDVDESKSFYSMDDGKLTAVLVKAIQELSAKVEALENA
jgi:hypothetical protein